MHAGDRRPVGLHSVFERTLHDERRALIGWGVGLVVLAIWMLALYPTVRDMADINKLFESYPEAFRKMFGIDDYTSGVGYLKAEVFSLMAPLLLIVFGVLWGSDLTAGEEERRTIDLLLANPVSRRRILFEKWAALVLGVSAVGGLLGIFLAAGGPVVGLHVGLAPLSSAVLASVLLGVLYGTTALAVAATTGHRGLARGSVAALAVAAYLISSLSELADWLRPWRWSSPWYHALGVDPMRTGFAPGHLLVLIAMIGVLLLVALMTFDRRDLAV